MPAWRWEAAAVPSDPRQSIGCPGRRLVDDPAAVAFAQSESTPSTRASCTPASSQSRGHACGLLLVANYRAEPGRIGAIVGPDCRGVKPAPRPPGVGRVRQLSEIPTPETAGWSGNQDPDRAPVLREAAGG